MKGKPYQPNFRPSLIPPDKREKLAQDISWGRADPSLCYKEVERVAFNIAESLGNPDTPAVVRAHIRAYLSRLFSWDMTGDPETARIIYPIACRRISRPPFVPEQDYIDSLTGNDKAAAIKAAREAEKGRDEREALILTSMPYEQARELAAAIVHSTNNDDDDDARAMRFTVLIRAIGLETHPFHRQRLVDEAAHAALFQTMYYSEEYRAILAKALKTYGGFRG